MPLFETTPVDVEEVRKHVKMHWNAELGANVRASQNQTFRATVGDGGAQKQVFVRVTPNPGGKRTNAIELELRVLEFLEEKSLPICIALPSLDGGLLQVPLGELSVSVFREARGEVLDFSEYKWMLDEEKVAGVGQFVAKLHLALDEFQLSHPEHMKAARYWSELHDGVIKDYELHPEDAETQRKAMEASSSSSKESPSCSSSDPHASQQSLRLPKPFGLIHSDLNASNYYWDPEVQMPSVFDWDQLNLSWRAYDLAACIWPVITLQDAGSPIDLKPVPQANTALFTEQLISGYESVLGKGSVDRECLKRMLHKRRELYRIFCNRALSELEPGTFMYKFCDFMNNWLTGKADTNKEEQ
jgi:Ser/Thr protein kinase RdoA (MazF antagonist)